MTYELTTTAQAATSAAQAISVLLGTSWPSVMQFLAVALMGLVLVPTFKQHLIEYADARFHLPLWAKMLAPTGLSMLSGALLKMLGADTATAMAAVPVLATFTHIVNETPLALDLNGQLPADAQLLMNQANSAIKGAGKIAALLALCLLSVSLKADPAPAPVAGWCAGPALWGGSALYQTNGSGTLSPSQSALGGAEFAGYLGSWSGNEFAPSYTLGVMAVMDTAGTVNTPAVGLTGGFYLNGVPLTIFTAKQLTADAGGLLWGIGTNVQFSGWVPFLYLGNPGN